MTPLLDVRGLSKRFGGVQAVKDVSFQVRAGTVKALIGPNAKTPPADDALSRENLRFLEAYRAEIERLQKRVRDPLSREPQPQD